MSRTVFFKHAKNFVSKAKGSVISRVHYDAERGEFLATDSEKMVVWTAGKFANEDMQFTPDGKRIEDMANYPEVKRVLDSTWQKATLPLLLFKEDMKPWIQAHKLIMDAAKATKDRDGICKLDIQPKKYTLTYNNEWINFSAELPGEMEGDWKHTIWYAAKHVYHSLKLADDMTKRGVLFRFNPEPGPKTFLIEANMAELEIVIVSRGKPEKAEFIRCYA